MDNKQLDKIRARARAATGGPWGVEQDGRNVTVLNRATGTPVANCGLTDDEGAVADAEFIAEARTDLVDLADAVAALTTERTALRREVYAVRRALDEARDTADRYRYALRSAVGSTTDTEVRMTVPEVRRLAGLDPDTGRPADDGDVTAEQAPDLPQLAVPCPRCGAAAGAPCTSHGGTRVRPRDVHQARTHAYRDAQG